MDKRQRLGPQGDDKGVSVFVDTITVCEDAVDVSALRL